MSYPTHLDIRFLILTNAITMLSFRGQGYRYKE